MSGTKTNKIALISGVTGQTGSYLAELLLDRGFRVIGLKRRTSLITTERIDHIFTNPNFSLEYFDLGDPACMYRLLIKYQPDLFFNLAAQSHVRVSSDLSEYTVDTIAMGTLRLLNAIREVSPHTRFYQASSSEMFGDNPAIPLNESSVLCPASPYACAKVFAHHITQHYRKAYGLFACTGILFNHESERRGETFVTRKITLAAARIKAGLQKELSLGNLEAKRDWGYAGDYAEAIYDIISHENPDDFVIATGESHSVREFLETVFKIAGLDPYEYLKIDSRLFRPQEVPFLLGDASKAKRVLGWKPKVRFGALARKMFVSDYNRLGLVI